MHSANMANAVSNNSTDLARQLNLLIWEYRPKSHHPGIASAQCDAQADAHGDEQCPHVHELLLVGLIKPEDKERQGRSKVKNLAFHLLDTLNAPLLPRH